MAATPSNFAETPNDEKFAKREELPPDALSEILDAIHLRGGTVSHHRANDARRVNHVAGSRLVHIIERGDVQLKLRDGSAHLSLTEGDLVLIARGEPHSLLGDATASWVTGEFLVEDAIADPLLSVLPSTVIIRGTESANGWLRLSRDLLLTEVSLARPGSQVMISRILDLLFIHALRAWAADGLVSPGWLPAAMDPALGPVLSAIHQTPQHDWSVVELAQRANLSRSSFAERFTRLLGASPAAYIVERRLLRAAHLLRSTTEPVGQIAVQVGYASESAFSRAFRRRFGVPPRRWAHTDHGASGALPIDEHTAGPN